MEVPRLEVLAAVEFLIRRLAVLRIDPSSAVVHYLTSRPQRACHVRLAVETATAGHQERLTAVATNALAFGAFAAMAADCLAAPTIAQAATNLERICDLSDATEPPQPALIDSTGMTWRESGRPRIQARRQSGLVDAIDLTGRATRMTPTERMAFRTASPIPRRPAPPSTPTAPWPHSRTRAPVLPSSCIPQSMWPTVMEQLPRATVKKTGAWEVVASMILIRLGTFARWAPIALDLDLPASFAATPGAVLSRLVQSEMLDESLFVLDGLHQWLEDHHPPIDYARRRRLFADLTDPGPQWRTALADHGIVATDRRRRLLGHALYERITGSDARLRRCHPIPAGEQRVAYNEFRMTAVPLLADYLDAQARILLEYHDVDEPVRWEPVFDYDGGWSGSPAGPDRPSVGDQRRTTTVTPTDVDAVVHSLATSGRHDALLVDLISHARGDTILLGPQTDATLELYALSPDDIWEIADTGLQVLTRLGHTFGPAIDLDHWDGRSTTETNAPTTATSRPREERPDDVG